MDIFKARRAVFQKLHDNGCLVIPNPWDIGTARYLCHLGFQALATTNSGFAVSRGMPDTDRGVSRDSMLGHIAEIVAAVEIPVNADFRAGYADQPQDVAKNVRLCIDTGVAGLSIEDATEDLHNPLYDLPLAIDRTEPIRFNFSFVYLLYVF